MNGFAVYATPVGQVRIDWEDGAVVGLRAAAEFLEKGRETGLTALAAEQLRQYFAGERRSFDFPYVLRGTPFQRDVWNALLDIPYGQTRSYGEIARQLGRPGAARAVGAACGRNPVWIVVPCHRAVGADGKLTGYAGGLEMKQALLELETGKIEESR